MENLIDIFLTLTTVIFFLSIPVFWIYKLVQCILKEKFNIFSNENFIFNEKSIEILFSSIVFCICFLMLKFIEYSVTTGTFLERFDFEGNHFKLYTPLSFKHIITILIFFLLGILSYILIKHYYNKLANIFYVLCCSILIINIAFSIAFLLQISTCTFPDYLDINLIFIISRYSFMILILVYIIALKESLSVLKKREIVFNKNFKNKLINKLYILFINYNTKPIFCIYLSFPLLIIIQLILIPFGQQYDSFIKVFLDTTNYTFSQISIHT